MVKVIQVLFDDHEFDEIKKLKGEETWHDFIVNNTQRLAAAIQQRDTLKEQLEK